MDAGNPAALQLGVEIQQDRSWLGEFRADVKTAKDDLRSLADQQSRFNERQAAMARTQEAAMKRAYAAGEQFRKSMRQSFDHAAAAAKNAVNWTMRWGTVAGAAAAGGVTLLIRKGIQLNSQMQQFRLTLETVYRSRAQANDMLKWVERFAEKSPFNVESLVDASVHLESVGLNAKRYLPTIGNLASAFGGTRAEVDQLIRSLTLLNSGAPGMAMRTLFKFGISYDDFRRQGISVGSRNQLGGTSQERLQAFENIVNSRFPNLMAKQATTFQGVMSNIQDIYHRVLRQTTEPLFESVTQKVHQLYEWLQRLSDDGTLAEWSGRIGMSLKGAFGSLAGVAQGGFAAFRKDGMEAALTHVWDKIREPAGRFVNWFADKMASAFEALLKVGFKALPSLAEIAADHPWLTAAAGAYLAPNVMKSGAALGRGAYSVGSTVYNAANATAIGAGIGSLSGMAATVVGIPAATIAAGWFLSDLARNHYADESDEVFLEGERNPSRFGPHVGRNRFDQMDDTSVMSVAMKGRNPIADQMWSGREAVWKALPMLTDAAQKAADAVLALRDSIFRFTTSADAKKDQFWSRAQDIGYGLADSLDASPEFKLEHMQRQMSEKWDAANANPLHDQTMAQLREANASRIGINVDTMQGVIANADLAIQQRADAYNELLGLKKQEILFEQQLSTQVAKTNQALLDRVAELKPRDRARYFANVEKALGYQGLDPQDATRQLSKLDTKELNDIAGTGILDPGLVANARKQQLSGLARQEGYGVAADYLSGLAVTPRDPRQAMAEFQQVAEFVREKFGMSVDELTKAVAGLGRQLDTTLTSTLHDILDSAARKMAVKVEFPDALDVKAAIQLFDRNAMREWIIGAVRAAFRDATGVENAAETEAAVGNLN